MDMMSKFENLVNTADKQRDMFSVPMMNTNNTEAILIIYTPRMIPAQVLRPFEYNFNASLQNELISEQGMQKLIDGKQSDVLNTAILPVANGIQLNTATLNYMYSFVLVVNIGCGQGKFERTVRIGYFDNEPITYQFGLTPKVNERAVMFFTHTLTFTANNSINPMLGQQSRVSLLEDTDRTSGLINQYANTDMFLMLPGDIRRVCAGDVEGEGLLNLGTKTTENVPIPSHAKTPIHLLRSIAEGIDSAQYSVLDVGLNSIYNQRASVASSGRDIFTQTFDGQMIGSYAPPVTVGGIDNSVPMQLGQLVGLYPNIDIRPHQIPQNSAWDVYPQTCTSKPNTVCAFLSPAIDSLAIGFGISEIIFRYNSWMRDDFAYRQGSWKIFYCNGIVEETAVAQNRNLENFKRQVENTVFPIVKTLGGEFDIGVHYSLSAETVIKLIYFDESSNTNMDGFYENCNRLGGFNSPVVGWYNLFDNNVKQMNGLVASMADHFTEAKSNLDFSALG
jgi:hypothetical protein